MNRKTFTSPLLSLPLFLLTASVCSMGQTPTPTHYAGVLNDYSPFDSTIGGSPYEMHGQWSVDLDGQGQR